MRSRCWIYSEKVKYKSIIKIICYFGQWPEWIDFFVESCKWNPTIDWLIFTDCRPPDNDAPNVRYEHVSFADYTSRVSQRLKIDFRPDSPYKLCDLKPALGYVHESDIESHDFFAFGDIDIIYGNLRRFLSPEVLAHNVVSNHWNRISGHFAIFRNSEMFRNAFRQIPEWKASFETQKHLGLDESKFTKVFLKHRKHPLLLRKLWGLFSPYRRRCYFQEQYTTILSPIKWNDGNPEHPQTWCWRKGTLTNTRDTGREYMYLHFMNWKSNRWLPRPARSRPSAWQDLDSVIHTDYRSPEGWNITPQGFISP